MRKRIFDVIEISHEGDFLSIIYDYFMFATIIVSIIPLCFKEQNIILNTIDTITVMIFIVDYLLRLITADYKYEQHKHFAFMLYPFSPYAVIDLLSILPSLTSVYSGLRLLKIFRLFKTLRIFKFLRYSKNFAIIISVLRKQKDMLLSVVYLALSYIFIAGLLMFQTEPENFDSLFDALYWSSTALTTVGYGDIYPITFLGKLLSMISSIIGIAVVALPAGIITGGYIDEIQNSKSELNDAE